MENEKEFAYRGKRGKEGYKAFKKEIEATESRVQTLTQYIVDNKDTIPDLDKYFFLNSLKFSLDKLKLADIDFSLKF